MPETVLWPGCGRLLVLLAEFCHAVSAVMHMLCGPHGTDAGVHRTQAGEETVTEMRHFMLAADGQLHDLHSKLRLDHPGGQAMQLHKCIVSGSTGTLSALLYRPLCLHC